MSENRNFNALRVYKEEDGVRSEVEECTTADLPEGDLLLQVEYSDLNYKDALSARGRPGVTKRYPHTPGIDAIGQATEKSGSYEEGTPLIVTGFDLGMNTWGGFGEYVQVPSSWALPLPEGLSSRDAALYGTAGLTAGLAVDAIVSAGARPDGGPILVTGGTGGVGALAVGILSRQGYSV